MEQLHALTRLLEEVRSCQHCASYLPHDPKPIVRASPTARLLIVGQAPGTKVHASGIPWNDPSGDRLRDWLQLDRDTFYDETRIAIIPTGLCYPGRGKTGDLPPRPECAPRWHPLLLSYLPQLQLKLLIGQYAQRYYLQHLIQANVTETVRCWRKYWPEILPLPHPSPRNQLWLQRNGWFMTEVIPALRQRVKAVIEQSR